MTRQRLLVQFRYIEVAVFLSVLTRSGLHFFLSLLAIGDSLSNHADLENALDVLLFNFFLAAFAAVSILHAIDELRETSNTPRALRHNRARALFARRNSTLDIVDVVPVDVPERQAQPVPRGCEEAPLSSV